MTIVLHEVLQVALSEAGAGLAEVQLRVLLTQVTAMYLCRSTLLEKINSNNLYNEASG